MSEPIACPVCDYQTLVKSHGAPGGSGWHCEVCDLREENRILQESRERLAAELRHARDPLADFIRAGEDMRAENDDDPASASGS